MDITIYIVDKYYYTIYYYYYLYITITITHTHIYLPSCEVCGILIPQTEIKPAPSAVKA